MGEEGVGLRPLGATALLVGLAAGGWVLGALWVEDGAASEPEGPAAVVVEATADAVAIRGLSRDRARVLQRRQRRDRSGVRLYSGLDVPDDPTFPSVAGELETHGSALRYVPRYRLAPGAAYTLVLDAGPDADWGPLNLRFASEGGPPPPPPVVRAVHPTASRLPANQLKMYVQLSRPMRTWEPYRHIELLDDETGEAVPAVFPRSPNRPRHNTQTRCVIDATRKPDVSFRAE